MEMEIVVSGSRTNGNWPGRSGKKVGVVRIKTKYDLSPYDAMKK
jgi:hypothetical protein